MMNPSKRILYQQLHTNEWHAIEERRVLAEGDTGRQRYRIVELAHYGRCMEINGCIQSTQADEGYYHEALLMPAIALHGQVKRVLCLGGANGGILGRLARIASIEALTQVDVDETLHHISRHYLAHMHPGAEPPFAFDLHFDDPLTWISREGGRYRGHFDLIVADLPDATAESYVPQLFTPAFYRDIATLLAPGGVYVSQAGQANPMAMDFHCRVVKTLEQRFPHVRSYAHFVPAYGTPWAFVLASQDLDPDSVAREILAKRIADMAPEDLQHYDLEAHYHMFELPRAFRARLHQAGAPIEDAAPATVNIRVDSLTIRAG